MEKSEKRVEKKGNKGKKDGKKGEHLKQGETSGKMGK